jgi:hypothetical protein
MLVLFSHNGFWIFKFRTNTNKGAKEFVLRLKFLRNVSRFRLNITQCKVTKSHHTKHLQSFINSSSPRKFPKTSSRKIPALGLVRKFFTSGTSVSSQLPETLYARVIFQKSSLHEWRKIRGSVLRKLSLHKWLKSLYGILSVPKVLRYTVYCLLIHTPAHMLFISWC